MLRPTVVEGISISRLARLPRCQVQTTDLVEGRWPIITLGVMRGIRSARSPRSARLKNCSAREPTSDPRGNPRGDQKLIGSRRTAMLLDHLFPCGLMTTGDAGKAVNCVAAHSALAMTTLGDTSIASLEEVERVMHSGSARVV